MATRRWDRLHQAHSPGTTSTPYHANGPAVTTAPAGRSAQQPSAINDAAAAAEDEAADPQFSESSGDDTDRPTGRDSSAFVAAVELPPSASVSSALVKRQLSAAPSVPPPNGGFGFSDDLAASFQMIAEWLPARDVLLMARVSRRMREESSRGYIWSALCSRDFLVTPQVHGSQMKRAYAFLSLCPRVGDLVDVEIGVWVCCRVVLRLDERWILLIPTRQPTRAGVMLFVWANTDEDSARLRPHTGAVPVANFHCTRAEQLAVLSASQTAAANKLLAGPTAPQWPMWHPALASMAAYSHVEDHSVWDGAGSGAAGTWLLWCCCDVLGGRSFAVVADPFWRAMQVFPKAEKPLQFCGKVIADPKPGDLLEVLDTVNVWYCAQVTAVNSSNGSLSVSFDGWEHTWDEEIDPVAQSHRLRRLGSDAAKGPSVGFDRHLSPLASFVDWGEFVRSAEFNRERWLVADTYRVVKRRSLAVGDLLVAVDMRNVAATAEVVSFTLFRGLPTVLEVRYIAAEESEEREKKTDSLHVISDRHRLRQLSGSVPVADVARMDPNSRPNFVEFEELRFEEVVFDSPPWENTM